MMTLKSLALLGSGAFVFLACGDRSPPPNAPVHPDEKSAVSDAGKSGPADEICVGREPDGGISVSVVACNDADVDAGRAIRLHRVDAGPPASAVRGRLAPEKVQAVVRAGFDAPRRCYERGLARNPKLTGRVLAKFVIGLDGRVTSVADGGSTLPDEEVVRCVLATFETLQFPAPSGGTVTVVYPVVFNPGE